MITTVDDIITVCGTGLRRALLASQELQAAMPGLSQRIVMQVADANTPMPYVLVTYLWGMNENRTPRKAFDIYWQVQVIGPDQAQVAETHVLVKVALEWQNLPYPAPWQDYAGCTYSAPILGQIEIQGNEYHSVGGVYRLRAAVCLD